MPDRTAAMEAAPLSDDQKADVDKLVARIQGMLSGWRPEIARAALATFLVIEPDQRAIAAFKTYVEGSSDPTLTPGEVAIEVVEFRRLLASTPEAASDPRVAALQASLRSLAIEPMPDDETGEMFCRCCGGSWKEGETEEHANDCWLVAALSVLPPEPLRVPNTGAGVPVIEVR